MVHFILLSLSAEIFEFAAVVTDAFEYSFYKRQVADMKNRFGQFDMPEVALTILALAARDAPLASFDNA